MGKLAYCSHLVLLIPLHRGLHVLLLSTLFGNCFVCQAHMLPSIHQVPNHSTHSLLSTAISSFNYKITHFNHLMIRKIVLIIVIKQFWYLGTGRCYTLPGEIHYPDIGCHQIALAETVLWNHVEFLLHNLVNIVLVTNRPIYNQLKIIRTQCT